MSLLACQRKEAGENDREEREGGTDDTLGSRVLTKKKLEEGVQTSVCIARKAVQHRRWRCSGMLNAGINRTGEENAADGISSRSCVRLLLGDDTSSSGLILIVSFSFNPRVISHFCVDAKRACLCFHGFTFMFLIDNVTL